jgi:glycosyltransferase involved in cell wall biosynthesis
MPRISVVIPVFNRAETVNQAISSLLRQDFEDFEIVVVDDGSTDSSVKVIRAMNNPRIRVFQQPRNMGGNAARNRGIREASAPVICFLDSDDEFLPHKLGYVDRYFRGHPDVDVLIDSFELLYPPELHKAKAARHNPQLTASKAVEEAIFSRQLFKATPAISARRDALLRVGLFDETLKRRQDMDLILRLARTVECRSVPDVLWTKHWSKGAISSKQETFMVALIEMCERHSDYLTQPAFRKGLARDFARHFIRLAIAGRGATIRRDLQRFTAFRNRKEALTLFAQGLWEMSRRAFSGRRV